MFCDLILNLINQALIVNQSSLLNTFILSVEFLFILTNLLKIKVLTEIMFILGISTDHETWNKDGCGTDVKKIYD